MKHLLVKHKQHIQSVRICHSDLTDSVLESLLVGLPNLTRLHLSNCHSITGVGIEARKGKDDDEEEYLALEDLKLSLYSLTEVGLSNIMSHIHSGSLRWLNLIESPQLSDASLLSVAQHQSNTGVQLLSGLTRLYLEDLQISFSDPLPSLLPAQLAELDITRNYAVNDDTFVSLLNSVAGTLKNLKISGTSLTLSKTSMLTPLNKLIELDMNLMAKVTETGFVSFMDKVGCNLKMLSISGLNIKCSEVGSMTALTNLEKLHMAMCSRIDQAGFTNLINKVGANLKKLNMGRLYDVELTEIVALTQSTKLEELDMRECTGLTDTFFISLINKVGANLKNLNMSNSSVSLFTVDALKPLTNLEVLDVSRMKNVTEPCLNKFLNKVGAGLKELNMSQCRFRITESLTPLPNLEILSLSNNKVKNFASFIKNLGANLKVLDLGDVVTDFNETDVFNPLTKLEVICMEGTRCKGSEIGLINFINKAGLNLRKLVMSELKGFSLTQVDQLTQLDRLEELKINEIPGIQESSLVTLLNRAGRQLRVLEMNHLEISLSQLSALTPLEKLVELQISDWENLDDTNFIALINKVGLSLQKLEINSLNISLSKVGSLLERRLTCLEELDVSYSDKIIEANLLAFLAKSRLKRLDKMGTQVSEAAILALFPRVTFLPLPPNELEEDP